MPKEEGMAKLNKQFKNFHESIKLLRFKDNQQLREKRDAVVNKFKAGFASLFESKEQEVPQYEILDQGSYRMGTGVKPIDGDFDIDLALKISVNKNDYDPLTVKQWVYDSVHGHTKNVRIKNSCVQIQYQKNDEPVYHVDLGVFSSETINQDGKCYLSKGTAYSESKNRFWQESNPQTLEDTLMEKYSADEKAQYRRCIRYIKRWKDVNFSDGTGKPSGIALTIAAYNWFQPIFTFMPLSNDKEFDDQSAFHNFVQRLLNNFSIVWDGDRQQISYRIEVKLPISPYTDLVGKMTLKEMDEFKYQVESLLKNLDAAKGEADPHEAAKKIVEVLGDDFPVPEKQDTAVKRAAAIISSTEAG